MHLKGEYFFVNYRHLLSEWETTNLLSHQKCTYRVNIFRQFLPFIVNYRQLLSEWETTNLWSLQKWYLKVNIFSSIIVIYCNLSSLIVGVKRQWIFYLFRNDLKGWIFFRQLSLFILNYRQLLSGWKKTNLWSLQKWSKGWIFFVIYRH